MPVVHVDARNLGRVLQKHFRDRQAMLAAATYEVAHRGAAEAVRITNAEGLVYLGTYKRGFRVIDPGGRVTLGGRRDMRFNVRKGATLRNDTPYAGVIELGRRPNRPGPPVAPIREWVRRKLGLTGRELESATFAIRLAIHRHGSRPRFVMRRVYEKMKVWFRAEAERRLRAGR